MKKIAIVFIAVFLVLCTSGYAQMTIFAPPPDPCEESFGKGVVLLFDKQKLIEEGIATQAWGCYFRSSGVDNSQYVGTVNPSTMIWYWGELIRYKQDCLRMKVGFDYSAMMLSPVMIASPLAEVYHAAGDLQALKVLKDLGVLKQANFPAAEESLRFSLRIMGKAYPEETERIKSLLARGIELTFEEIFKVLSDIIERN